MLRTRRPIDQDANASFGGIRRDHRGVPLKEEAETRAYAFVRLS